MILTLNLSLMLVIIYYKLIPDAPNWVLFLLLFSSGILYMVTIDLWEKHCKKVEKLEREIEKLKEHTNGNL